MATRQELSYVRRSNLRSRTKPSKEEATQRCTNTTTEVGWIPASTQTEGGVKGTLPDLQ